MRYFAGLALFLVALLFAAPDAAAQYKNRSFGIDAGAWLLTKPSVLDENNNPLQAGNRPLRFDYGIRVGGESNFKMNSDHWWFTVRVSVGLFQFGGDPTGSGDEQFDALAKDALGTILGLEGQMGVRYVLLTDRVRPYIQVGLSYMRLLSFSSDDQCTDVLFCNGGLSTQNAFLPTNDIGAVHLQPGLELIIERDVALHFFVDVQRWIRFNAPDNWAPVFGAGVNFYS